MDERTILRAAEITVRRAILKRFPPGKERDERLRWLEGIVATRFATAKTMLLDGSVAGAGTITV